VLYHAYFDIEGIEHSEAIF